MAAWEVWRRDSDASLALSEAEDAARCSDTLQAGEIVDRQFLLLEAVSDCWACTCWSAWDLIDDRPATLLELGESVTAEAVAFDRWLSDPADTQPPVLREDGVWKGVHWHALEGAPGGNVRSARRRSLSPLSVFEQVLAAVQSLLQSGRRHGQLSGTLFLLPAGRPAWLVGHSLREESSEAGSEGTDATRLARTLLAIVASGEVPESADEGPWDEAARFLPALPEFDTWREAVGAQPSAPSVSVAELCASILAAPCVRHSLAREAASRGDWTAVADHLAALDALTEHWPVDARLLKARAMEHLGTDEAEAAWRGVLEAHETRDQAYEALRALAVIAPQSMSLAEGMWLTALGHGLADNAALQQRLGELMMEDGNAEPASALLVDSVMKRPDDEALVAHVLPLLRSMGDWRGWLSVVKRVLEDREDPALREAMAEVEQWVFRRSFDPDRDAGAGDGAASVRWRSRAAEPTRADLDALKALGDLTPSQWIRRIALHIEDGEPHAQRLAEARSRYPHHPGLQRLQAQLHASAGEWDQAAEQWQAIADQLEGMGHPWWEEAQHALASRDWRAGRATEAAGRWHALLDGNPDDRQAWWGLTRVTWLDTAPDVLRVLPPVATPEEALARLLCGLVSEATMRQWLADQSDAQAPTLTGHLAMGALLVEHLSDRIGDALFDRLAEASPEAALAVEATRMLFGPEQDRSPVEPEDTYRWTGDSPLTLLGSERRWAFGGCEDGASVPLGVDLDGLLQADTSGRAIEAAMEEPALLWTEGDESDALELRDGQGRVWRLSGSEHTLGGADLDDLVVPGLSDARLRLQREGGHWYAASAVSFLANGRTVDEVRLLAGMRLDLDGIGLTVVGASGEGATESIEIPPQPEGPVTQQPPEALLRVSDLDGHPLGAFELSGSVIYLGRNPAMGPIRSQEEWEYRILRDGGRYTVSRRLHPSVFAVDASGVPHRVLEEHTPLRLGNVWCEVRPLGEPDSLPVDEGPAALLRLSTPNGTQQDLWIDGEFYSIGRGADMDLRLQGDPKASRHHCTLVHEPDGTWMLRDFGSANGTFVNGERTEAHRLEVGDAIEVGSVTLVFMGADDEDDVELLDLD